MYKLKQFYTLVKIEISAKMSSIQGTIEVLLHKSVGTIIKKPSAAGLPKKLDTFISSISIIAYRGASFGEAFEVDLSWLGRQGISVLPDIGLHKNPVTVVPFRTKGGGLLLKTGDILFKRAALEISLLGNVYKIKGREGAYSMDL